MAYAKFTATVRMKDEDYGFTAEMEITAEVDPGSSDSMAEMVGQPICVDCREARTHLAYGASIRCVPNEDETTREFGMRLWLNAQHDVRNNARESWVMAFLAEQESRAENAEYYRQTAGSDVA